MPDIKGHYSLLEAARKLNVTSAWINRVQRETGIGGGTGQKGRSVSFTEEMIETFRRIKVLRLIGFSFPYIKGLYEMEENVIKIAEELGSEYELSSITKAKIPLILHHTQITAISGPFLADIDKNTQQMLYKDKKIKVYTGYIDRLCSSAKEALEKVDTYMESVDDVIGIAKVVFGKFPINFQKNKENP